MTAYIEDGFLKGKKAIELWLEGKDEWNKCVEKNPEARVDFSEVEFNKIDTINKVFNGYSKEPLNHYISFEGFKFPNGGVNFELAIFGNGDIDFRGATFGDGNVSFMDADFGCGNVSFMGAKFGNGNVFFTRATFGDGTVSFYGATFGDGRVVFDGAKCDGLFDFRPKGIEKIKDLSFYACTFKGVMVLHGTYNCVPDLRNTITSSHVDLSDLKINKESKKLLKERSRLKAINFVEKLMGRQLLEREKSILEKFIDDNKGKQREKIKEQSNIILTQGITYFFLRKGINETLTKNTPEFMEDMHEIYFEEFYNLSLKPNQETSAQFCRLKELAEQNRAHDRALDFFAEECRMNRNWEVLSWLRRVPSWLWGGLCWLWGVVPSWLRRVPSFLWGGLCWLWGVVPSWLRRVPSLLWGGLCWLRRMLLKLPDFLRSCLDVLYCLFCRHGRSIGRPVLGLVLSWLVFSWVYASVLPWLRPVICSEYSYVHGYEYPKFSDAFLLNIFNSVPFLGFTRHGYKDVFEDVFGSDPILLDYIAIGLQSLTAFIFLFLIGLGIRNRFRI